ncbi:MAG: methyltransferase domain-containing protein [Proteobacteria bacterium]|nr:methyltransferase domain-containing protein [Pseudomonadota bacterium]
MNLYRKLRNIAWRASVKPFDRGPHLSRYYMYNRLKEVGRTLPNRTGRVLSISRSANVCEILELNPSEIVEADYPEHNMLSLKFPDESFDYVISDQVLEHVEGPPHAAVEESRRVLKPGGVAIHTTCFINPIHEAPADYWRFSPFALKHLHRNWSETIEVGGWGNFDIWIAELDGVRYTSVPHAKWHPFHKLAMKNDPNWPIVTWVIARK